MMQQLCDDLRFMWHKKHLQIIFLRCSDVFSRSRVQPISEAELRQLARLINVGYRSICTLQQMGVNALLVKNHLDKALKAVNQLAVREHNFRPYWFAA